MGGLPRHRLQPDLRHHSDDPLDVVLREDARDALIAQVGVGALVKAGQVNDTLLGQVIDDQVEELGLVAVEGPAVGKGAERLLGCLSVKADQ